MVTVGSPPFHFEIGLFPFLHSCFSPPSAKARELSYFDRLNTFADPMKTAAVAASRATQHGTGRYRIDGDARCGAGHPRCRGS